MKEYFNNLLKKWSCLHKWELHNKANIFELPTSIRPYKQRQTLICQICGKIKKIEI